VMSYYSMAFVGATPFGSLAAGAAASHIGTPITLSIGGTLCIAGAVWFATQLPQIRSLVRPLYAQLGIIPPMTAGIQAASALQVPPED
jgi:fucose permease